MVEFFSIFNLSFALTFSLLIQFAFTIEEWFGVNRFLVRLIHEHFKKLFLSLDFYLHPIHFIAWLSKILFSLSSFSFSSKDSSLIALYLPTLD